jgi:hypothetical protein
MIRIIQRKLCPICQEWFERPTGKSDKVWKKQVCCGASCAAISRRKENPINSRRVNLVPGENRYKGWGK